VFCPPPRPATPKYLSRGLLTSDSILRVPSFIRMYRGRCVCSQCRAQNELDCIDHLWQMSCGVIDCSCLDFFHSFDGKAEFSASLVFSVTGSFRNHSKLICCSINIYFYQCWIQVCGIFDRFCLIMYLKLALGKDYSRLIASKIKKKI